MRTKFFVLLLSLSFAMTVSAQTTVIDSLRKIVAQGKRDSTEMAACIHLADELARRDIPASKRYSMQAVNLARQLHHPYQLSAAYAQMVLQNVQTNQKDSAKYYLELLKQLAEQYSRIEKVNSNYNFTAGMFYRLQGNYKASQPFMIENLAILKQNKNMLGLAGQTLNIGNNFTDMGEYGKAMTYHLQALKLFETLGNKRGMSFCYSEIAADFIKLKQFKGAIPYVERSMALKNELNDKKGKAAGYTRLGEIAEGLHQPDKALASYMDALALNKELQLPVEEAKNDLSIGKLYAAKRDVVNAQTYLERSSTLLKQVHDTIYVAAVNAELAALKRNLHDQQTTEKTFLNTINTSVATGDKNTEIDNYKYLANFYAQNKDYEKALFYNEKYHSKADSVQGKELQLQVKGLEQQYNLEKKEKELILLRKDKLLYQANEKEQKLFRYGAIIFLVNLIIIGLLLLARYRTVQKAKRLIEIERMRNNIARNLHDDIGSTLSSINILSKVALKQADGNPNVLSGLEKIKDSSFTIMESMSDIVWAINPANDPLEKTILKMKEFAVAILEPAGIGFAFNEDGKLADLKLGVDERKNLYLIFKEAINNIAKYSEATFADIVLHKTAHQFLMKISDNGKGFDNDKLYSGNGLKNMQSRSGEMNAVFEIASRPSAGTQISLAIAIT